MGEPMSRIGYWFAIFLLSANMAIFYAPSVEADDQSSTATELSQNSAITNWICSPDCDDQPVDEVDWYVIELAASTVGQVFVENTGDYSSVDLQIEIYEGNQLSLIDSFEAGDGANDSGLIHNNLSVSEQYFISISTVDGWYADGTNYSISLFVETDNHWSGARSIEVNSFLEEDLVCISDCPDGLIDSQDWYHFSVEAAQSIGIVAEEISWFATLDFELFSLGSSGLEPFDYHYAGGSAGGAQDHSVRAWFNTTESMEVYVRVHTNFSDDVVYNLSVSSGEWIDIIEDEYHWIAFPELQLGDEIRVQAIRTDYPNDLDILLFNSSEFQNYRDEVVNNASTSPSELLAEEDCLVCSISFVLSAEKVGLMDVKPQTTHDVNQPISWSPTLILVADYTDYRQNPPYDSTVDVASVFMSVSVLNTSPVEKNYAISERIADEWVLVDSGTTMNGEILPPNQGWNSDSTEIDANGSRSTYQVIVWDEVSGVTSTNSTFEVTNLRPESCIDVEGSFGDTFHARVDVRLDASCSSDADMDELAYEWMMNGGIVSNDESFEIAFQPGEHVISLLVLDELGLASTIEETINVTEFPFGAYNQTVELELAPENSTMIHVENTLFDNTTVSPQWLNFGVIGTEIGIGLNIESRVVQSVEYGLHFTQEMNQTLVTKKEVNSTIETALKVNLGLFVKDIESGNETLYDLPMPMKEALYEDQPWFPVGLFDRVYYWGDLAVIHTSNASEELDSNTSFEVEISALDIMNYITNLATLLPGSQIPLLALGIAVDYNLYLDIDLRFEVLNEGQMSLVIMEEGLDAQQELIHSNVSHMANQTLECFPYSIVDSSVLVFGGIGLRLRIAQPAWLTTGLGFFYEDPMFLEGVWEYTLVESEEAIGSSFGRNAHLGNASVSITVPMPSLVIETESEKNDSNGNQSLNATNSSSNTSGDPGTSNETVNGTNQSNGSQNGTIEEVPNNTSETGTPPNQDTNLEEVNASNTEPDLVLIAAIGGCIFIAIVVLSILRSSRKNER
jgi:hypothetical protein